MEFNIYSIFDIINNSNNDLIIRPYNESAIEINKDDINKYFICVNIDIIRYNDKLFNKCLQHKDNEELIKKYKNKMIYNKDICIENCYEVDFN